MEHVMECIQGVNIVPQGGADGVALCLAPPGMQLLPVDAASAAAHH
jgi:hypothetical protein